MSAGKPTDRARAGNVASSPQKSEPREVLELLLTRHSVGPKHLIAPGPTEDQLWLAAGAALRGPDHQKLLPYQFVVVPPDARPRLAQLFAEFASREGKSAEEIAIERDRAMLAPALIAFIVRVDPTHLRVHSHEQWLAAGGALANFLMALHAMGYGAKMLSGRKVEDEAIARAFCDAGERLIGWIATGTASKPAHPRESDNPDAVLRKWIPP